MTTFLPFGPRVTATASANLLTPASMRVRALVPKLISLPVAKPRCCTTALAATAGLATRAAAAIADAAQGNVRARRSMRRDKQLHTECIDSRWFATSHQLFKCATELVCSIPPCQSARVQAIWVHIVCMPNHLLPAAAWRPLHMQRRYGESWMIDPVLPENLRPRTLLYCVVFIRSVDRHSDRTEQNRTDEKRSEEKKRRV
jgi:hypothetical protein